MRKIAYGVFTNRSRGLPVAVFQSKWHAQGYIDSQHSKKFRGFNIQRIWFATEDKHTFTILKHIGYETQVKV